MAAIVQGISERRNSLVVTFYDQEAKKSVERTYPANFQHPNWPPKGLQIFDEIPDPNPKPVATPVATKTESVAPAKTEPAKAAKTDSVKT